MFGLKIFFGGVYYLKKGGGLHKMKPRTECLKKQYKTVYDISDKIIKNLENGRTNYVFFDKDKKVRISVTPTASKWSAAYYPEIMGIGRLLRFHYKAFRMYHKQQTTNKVRFKWAIRQLIIHELTHYWQDVNKNLTPRDYTIHGSRASEYLRHPDEIEAISQEIVFLKKRYGNKKTIKQLVIEYIDELWKKDIPKDEYESLIEDYVHECKCALKERKFKFDKL